MGLILSLFLVLAPSGGLHVPHDDVHGIATADLSSGVRETLITTQLANRVLRTRNEGLTWESIHGDGLELARADLVVWDPHPDGQRFLIGTNLGVWAYDPLTEVASKLNSGLATGEARSLTGLTAPTSGSDGPVVMVTVPGRVYGLNRLTQEWEELLDSGHHDLRGQIAINPQFSETGPVGPGQTMAASINGLLYLSDDGGENWSVQPQFSSPALLPTDPVITAISFADDFQTSGVLVLATAVENLNNFTGDEGTLWRSGDFGALFSQVLQADSSFRCIAATPPAPSGKRWFLAAVLRHPDFGNLANSDGIFRSSDGGQVWNDYGTAQDFIHEADASDTVSLDREEIIDFEISPTFATDGEILFGRSEGLFLTKDEGLHWSRQAFRPSTHIRGLDSFVDKQGDLWSVSATYGSGTIVQNLTTALTVVLDESPMNYQDELALSPNFIDDGTFMVGGARGLSFWFDPTLQASNPHNIWGWKGVPRALGLGYARFVAFSPHYDSRGGVGTDQTFFFSTSTLRAANFRSTDGGLTGQLLDKLADGSQAPWLGNIAIAPTYDASTSAGRTDVYGTYATELFRLHDTRWHHVYSLPATIETMSLAADFDRNTTTPGRPLIFVGMRKFPYFAILEDRIVSKSIAYYPVGLEEGSVIKVVCPPDFATRPVVYAATFTDGVMKLDLTQPTPTWERVGGDFPGYFVDAMCLSPNFANDRVIMVGTQAGLVVGADIAGQTWTFKPTRYSRDNEGPAFHYYQPNHPANSQPDRPWRWDTQVTESIRDHLVDVRFRGYTVAFAQTDGAYVEFSDRIHSLQVHSFGGPEAGTIVITLENADTGAPIDSLTMDLQQAVWGNRSFQFTFPLQAVNVRVEAVLDPGEKLYFDGATFIPF